MSKPKKFQLEIQRSTIVMANVMIKAIKHPAAAVLTKVTDRIDKFLEEYPGQKYRLTAECVDDEKPAERPATDVGREEEEERADPSETHYR